MSPSKKSSAANVTHGGACSSESGAVSPGLWRRRIVGDPSAGPSSGTGERSAAKAGGAAHEDLRTSAPAAGSSGLRDATRGAAGSGARADLGVVSGVTGLAGGSAARPGVPGRVAGAAAESGVRTPTKRGAGRAGASGTPLQSSSAD